MRDIASTPSVVPNLNDSEIYKEQSRICRQEAEVSKNILAKVTWLRLAEQWHNLAQEAEAKEPEDRPAGGSERVFAFG